MESILFILIIDIFSFVTFTFINQCRVFACKSVYLTVIEDYGIFDNNEFAYILGIIWWSDKVNEDRLWYNASSSIWCEDEDGNVYRSGDFKLDGSKIIKWTGDSPTIGKKYVIKYNAYLEWIAFDPPAVRRDRNRDLGQRVGLRRRHVALIDDDPRARVGDKIPFCSRVSTC